MFRPIRPLLLCGLLLASFASARDRTPSHQTLRTQCLLHAADPANPWALAHGITGLGKDFAAADGRRAADVIIADYLRKATDPTQTTYSFIQFKPDGTPVEPHSNLHIKTLVLAGFAPTATFKASFGKVTLEQLVDGVKRGFRHAPKVDEYWRDAGWTLDLLATTLKPGPTAWFVNGAGERVDFNAVMEDALSALERHDGDLLAAMEKNVAQVPKRKQGIYSHHCGGLHFAQAIFHWARFPDVRKKWGSRIDRQVKLLFWRLNSEQPQYDAMLQQVLNLPDPTYKLMVLTQLVKFHGHLLETLGRIQANKVYTFDKQQKLMIEKVKALLDHAVTGLKEAKAFDNMERFKTSQKQLYLDLVGDSCHAAHGLELWR